MEFETMRPSSGRELLSEMAAIFWDDNGPTYVMLFVIAPTVLKVIHDFWGSMTVFRSMLSWSNLKFNLECAVVALPFIMWKAHCNITQRYRAKIAELEKQYTVQNDRINDLVIDRLNMENGKEQKEVKLKLAIGEPDFHRGQKAFYLQGTVTNEGGDTVRGVKVKLVNFTDFTTTVPKSFDLAWSLSRIGPLDMSGGQQEVFDIGMLQSTGYPPTLQLLLYVGSRATPQTRHQGKYPLEIQILADGMEPITQKIDVTVAEGPLGNTISVARQVAAVLRKG